MIEADGRFYLPPRGLSSAGTSIEAVLSADRLLDHVERFQAFLAANPDYLTKAMSEQGVSPPSCPDFHFAFFEDGGYGIIETQTRTRFRLAA